MAGERIEKALKVFRERYRRAGRDGRSRVLNEFCAATGYHRKYAISLLNRPVGEQPHEVKRKRGVTYSARAIRAVEIIWEAAGYPWSERLKGMLPVWMPWAKRHVAWLSASIEQEVLSISARQIDRRLRAKKRVLKRRLYGRTKPGTLLKHHIPVKTDCWDVHEPGFTEIDLVSHSGQEASGEFIHSLNLTDVQTGWVETRAVMGRGESGVVEAIEEIRQSVPFRLQGIDSDNGSEFINHHLYGYCQRHRIQFTRGRPYKKDDNAHIEQKNWTHVRKIFGWDRYDTVPVLDAMNKLYRGELRRMMNLFQSSVKLRSTERVGSRLRRRYDAAQTPLDRLVASYATSATPLPTPVQDLLALRQKIDPFELSATIQRSLEQIERLRSAPRLSVTRTKPTPSARVQIPVNTHKETAYASLFR